MMKDSLNKKTYLGDIEPNPKEFGIWVKEDGSTKVYDYIENEWVGGLGNGETSTIEYLDVSGVGDVMRTNFLSVGVPYAKAEKDGIVIAAPSSALSGANMLLIECLKAVVIDKTATVAMLYGTQATTMTFIEALEQTGVTQEQLDAIPRITKEQFYNLEA